MEQSAAQDMRQPLSPSWALGAGFGGGLLKLFTKAAQRDPLTFKIAASEFSLRNGRRFHVCFTCSRWQRMFVLDRLEVSVALAEYCTSPTSHITIRLAVDWLYHMWSKAILLLPLPYVQSASSVEWGLPWFVIQTRPQACPGSRHKCRNLKVLLHKTMKASAATSSSSAQKDRRLVANRYELMFNAPLLFGKKCCKN